MDRFLDPFYPVNALLVLVYFPLRVYFTRVTPEGSDYSRLHSLHEFSTWVRWGCRLLVANSREPMLTTPLLLLLSTGVASFSNSAGCDRMEGEPQHALQLYKG